MKQFFNELEKLLKRYNATILRSTGDGHNLVCSIEAPGNTLSKFRDFQFNEEITANCLHYGKYREINKPAGEA